MEYGVKTLKYKGKIVFEKLALPYFKGKVPKEYQENEACFIFVNKGEFTVRSAEKKVPMNSNTGMLAKCFNYFMESNFNKHKNEPGIEVVGVLLYPEMVNELFNFDISKSSHFVNYNVKQVQIDSLLDAFKNSLNVLLDNPDLADEEMIGTKIKEFILILSKSENAPSHLDFLSAMFKPNELEFTSTVQNNLYSSLSILQLSTMCNMSTSSFKRKFQETYNESPKRYFAKKKSKKAAEMLSTKELRVSDIAYDCGFESLATFNRTFKSFYGKSPSAYRLS